MVTHELKSWPEMFEPLLNGKKTFELRYNDRRFEVGDILVLKEWIPDLAPGHWGEGKYTGRSCTRLVTFILHGVGIGAIAPLKGLAINYVILAVVPGALHGGVAVIDAEDRAGIG